VTHDVGLLVAVAGILVLAAALVALVYVSEARLRQVAAEQRRIHLQQSNIIAMLLRAGFRGPRAARDWGDSGNWTQVRGDSSDGYSGQ
jgi:hypothetical protein